MSTITAVPITDAARIAERIAFLNFQAKRCVPRVGTDEFPTPWDLMHSSIDQQLDEWIEA